ncbi:hypothetical protein ACIBQX_32840 [Nonomuraea sp. NPDC049714]|uniref:hypothetical protein n=1 Tax=Nonomuraea sp. NPDC049714 TaxID=3364357 RepID=UPI0037B00F2A
MNDVEITDDQYELVFGVIALKDLDWACIVATATAEEIALLQRWVARWRNASDD